MKRLLRDGHNVVAIDNLSNGRKENILEFADKEEFEFIEGDIKDSKTIDNAFDDDIDICYHLGASINVQDSLDDPLTTFNNDVVGTFNVLEACKRGNTKMVFMSTCMVYDRADDDGGITEEHPTKPASPYAGSKLAGENMVLSYWYGYGLPVVVIRPFNTYGPFQKTGGEGGVVAIFIKKMLDGDNLNIYGTGTQTRDLLYVEDCADFVVEVGYRDEANGEILNAGLGRDVTINGLASMIENDEDRIHHVKHIHPQSEIQKLLCNYEKADNLLNWRPRITLEEGIKSTTDWIKNNPDLM